MARYLKKNHINIRTYAIGFCVGRINRFTFYRGFKTKPIYPWTGKIIPWISWFVFNTNKFSVNEMLTINHFWKESFNVRYVLPSWIFPAYLYGAKGLSHILSLTELHQLNYYDIIKLGTKICIGVEKTCTFFLSPVRRIRNHKYICTYNIRF